MIDGDLYSEEESIFYLRTAEEKEETRRRITLLRETMSETRTAVAAEKQAQVRTTRAKTKSRVAN